MRRCLVKRQSWNHRKRSRTQHYSLIRRLHWRRTSHWWRSQKSDCQKSNQHCFRRQTSYWTQVQWQDCSGWHQAMAIQSRIRPRRKAIDCCQVQGWNQEIPSWRNLINGSSQDERNRWSLPWQDCQECCRHCPSLFQWLLKTSYQRCWNNLRS